MKLWLLVLLIPIHTSGQDFSNSSIARWEKQAQNITIYRDSFGIPHIYGKTDADAVFGLLYAQCEDDFQRVEMNYIEKLGRLAEIKGEEKLYDDLLIRLVIDQNEAKKDYANAPSWLKKICNAFADGINFYLYKHPQVKPVLLQKFEPWFPFLWTDGSIGAINTAGISVDELKRFYTGDNSVAKVAPEIHEPEMTGSNGFAFSPKITENGNAILYINPHVTFYFRPEVHMVSEEGLNAYGAVTWGQFFIYQGFNEHCGWMHTSSAVDAADAYSEVISKNGSSYLYEYDGNKKIVQQKIISLQYKTEKGFQTKNINAFYTHHGPVIASRNAQWLSLKADNRLKEGLQQCWLRTKARNLRDFQKTLDLKGNISNNTVYADTEGNIAYWHGNRIPVRDTSFDWSKPVNGSIKATEWKGYHSITETVHSINPSNGWLQNCNSTPFTVSGKESPEKVKYPFYMAPDGENFRGINAVRVLNEQKLYNLDKVIKAGYDTKLLAFEVLIPALIKAYDVTADNHTGIKVQIELLREWDYRSSVSSEATTLAIEWGTILLPEINKVVMPAEITPDQVNKTKWYANQLTAEHAVTSFEKAITQLENKHGTWRIPWGKINRFQRISSSIDNVFDDNLHSYPVGFASALWGQLPSYSSRYFMDSKNRYGYNGNSFICAVEFGKIIKAKSLLAGGNSGNPASPHFFDQGEMYSKGIFKEVLFYKEEVIKNSKRVYKPGIR